jgi:hypothetical protein
MSRIEKTVFISYRRTNAAWALAIYQYLNQHGYDAFIDFQGIASGGFARQKYLDLGGGMRDGDQAEVEQFIRDLKKKL